MKNLFIIIIVLISFNLFAQTATPPSAGDGSEGNPYQIATLDNLYWLSQRQYEWHNHFVQTTDIDASPTSSWDAGAGFSPIGDETNNFTGRYYGLGHLIDGLVINRPSTDGIGFFGRINSNSYITELGITNAYIAGEDYVGGLVGAANDAIVKDCYTTGTIGGEWNVGGLVGRGQDTFIRNCYSRATVIGYNYIGGLVGRIYASYYNFSWGINYCYSTGRMIGNDSVSGFTNTDDQYNFIDYCFWDIETSLKSSSEGGIGKTTEEMKDLATFNPWDFEYNPFDNYAGDWWRPHWDMDISGIINDGYPFLSWQNGDDVALLSTESEQQLMEADDFTVLPAYPNPFNPSTTIRYGLVSDSYVIVEIYDLTGKLITTLLNKEQTPGWHSVIWNGTNQQNKQVPAGIYLSKITSGNEVKTTKLMLLK